MASLPEQAIAAFERIHGLEVTVHDRDGLLGPHLRPDRQWHRQQACRAVKALGHGAACHAFDAIHVHAALRQQPDGRVHRCHAGFIEWAVPLFHAGALSAVLFAGLRRGGPGLAAIEPPTRTPIRWTGRTRLPPPVGGDRAALVMEHLRQLRSRISEWLLASGGHDAGSRRALIADAIANLIDLPVTLGDLAARMGVSAGRASRIIQREMGASFSRLCDERRMRLAADLLRDSRLSVTAIAARAGYQGTSRFHRAFSRRYGMTPLAWRERGGDG